MVFFINISILFHKGFLICPIECVCVCNKWLRIEVYCGIKFSQYLFCEKIFLIFTFNFFYCLLSMFFIKCKIWQKICCSKERLQEKSQLMGEGYSCWEGGSSKKILRVLCLKRGGCVFKGGLEPQKKLWEIYTLKTDCFQFCLI